MSHGDLTLGEIVGLTGGVIQTGPFGSQLHARDYQSMGTPVVMPTNLGDNVIREERIARIGDHDVRRLARHQLREGDVIFSRRGDVGRRAIVRAENSGWLCGTGCLAVKFGPRRADVNPIYVSLLIGTPKVQTWLVDNAVGGTMLNLNTSILSSLPLHLPSRHDQDAAVEALEGVFAQESSLKRLIAKKRDIKQGLMQELLSGRTRLPGFSGEWQTPSIGEFAEVKAGGTPSTAVPRYWGGQVRWMSSGEIHRKRIIEVDGRITDDGLRESAAQLLPVGTVLIALAGQGKTRGTVAVSEVELATNQSIAGILPSATHDPEFLYYYLDTRYEELRGESAGDGGRGGLNLSIIKRLQVLMPEIDEQRAVSGVLHDVDAEIAALDRRLGSARNIKRGMMQELLTGRTRLMSEVAS